MRRISLDSSSSENSLANFNRGLTSTEDPGISDIPNDRSCARPGHVSWLSLPNKSQLAIIVLARLAEPLSERSLVSYLFFQLQWLSPSLSDSAIAGQVGVITSVFAAAQCCTGMLWGRAADSVYFGRKRVLIIGLLGSCTSAVGMGFSRSFASAVFFRVLAGTMNGNVGVLRTMIAEIVEDKRYQPRAFLLLPMCFNVGVIIGPLISSFLVKPVRIGPDGSLSAVETGSTGRVTAISGWTQAFPYALTNLTCAAILLCAALAVVIGLDETHPSLRHCRDYGRDLGRCLSQRLLWRRDRRFQYEVVPGSIDTGTAMRGSLESNMSRTEDPDKTTGQRTSLPLRAIYTHNILIALLQNFVCAVHVSAFNTMLFVFLSAPRLSHGDSDRSRSLAGGLGLPVESVAFANMVIGIVGLPLQILLFPLVSERIGTLRSYRIFLPFSVLAYCLLPVLVLLPDRQSAVWPCLIALLTAHIISRTFVGPATTVLVNEAAPHPTVLGTIHGLAASSSAGARMLGPSVGGATLGWGLRSDSVGIPFWAIGAIAFLNLLLLWGLKL